jgi:hypothetical protein
MRRIALSIRTPGTPWHWPQSWPWWGENNAQQCSIRLRVDAGGVILGREVLSCDDVAALDRVLVAASPVPAPTDPCLLSSLNSIRLDLNSPQKKE